MKFTRILATILSWLCYASLAVAQAPPTPPGANVIIGNFAIAPSTGSARTILPQTNPGPWPVVTVANTGSTDFYVAVGDITVVATTASPVRVVAGTSVSFWANGQYIAYITGGGSSTGIVYQANGAVAVDLVVPGSGGGGGGGNVNVTQIAGASTATGTGASDAGTIRVATATDSLLGVKGENGTAIAAAANPVPVDSRQINGVTMTAGAGASGTGTQRIITATDSTIATITNPIGNKGVDGSTIATNANPLPAQLVTGVVTTATLQSAAVANGNGTTLATNGLSIATMTVNCATCSGGTTINFEGTEDGTNYTAVTGLQIGTSTLATTTVAAGITEWRLPIAGLQNVRARVSAYSAGTVTVTGRVSAIDTAAYTVQANQAGTWTVQPGNTPNTTAWVVQAVPGTTGGLSRYTLEPTASDNHAVIKNGAGIFYHSIVMNKSATLMYGRLYDAGTGFNGCNSATGLLWEFVIPANTSGAGFVEDIAVGIGFSTGLSICVTGGYGQTDTTNATATSAVVNVGYK